MNYAEADFSKTPVDTFGIIGDFIDGKRYIIQRVSPGRITQAVGGRDYNAFIAAGLLVGLIGVPFIFIMSYALLDNPHSIFLSLFYWEIIWALVVVIGLVSYYASTPRNSIFIELLDYKNGRCHIGFTAVGEGGLQLERYVIKRLASETKEIDA